MTIAEWKALDATGTKPARKKAADVCPACGYGGLVSVHLYPDFERTVRCLSCSATL